MLDLSANLSQTVFVHLCICICVFARQTPGNIVFEVLVSLPFRKYMVCMVQNLAQWRKDEMSRLWHTDTLTHWHTDRHRKVEQYSAEAESAISRWLDFKQQHFHILARIYIYSGWNIHIFWPEYTYILDGIYTPYFSPYNTHIFWPEYTYILAGIYIYSGWNIQLQSIDSNIVEWQREDIKTPQFGQLYRLFPPSQPFTRLLLK